MHLSSAELATRTTLPEFPRSAKYDPHWVLDNLMGPNVLWLTEALAQRMDLRPGMKVLDLGCGKALSSIFLAREFGVQVWAVDLWISAEENAERIQAAGLQNQVTPIHAEAHNLPFEEGFFDAAVSLDAYHYFGTDDLYFGYFFANLVGSGGQLGFVSPGLQVELEDQVPAEYLPYWPWDFCSFHSPQWWRRNWSRCGLAEVIHADWLAEGWRWWLSWLETRRDAGYPDDPSERQLLEMDAGRCMGFTRLVARKL